MHPYPSFPGLEDFLRYHGFEVEAHKKYIFNNYFNDRIVYVDLNTIVDADTDRNTVRVSTNLGSLIDIKLSRRQQVPSLPHSVYLRFQSYDSTNHLFTASLISDTRHAKTMCSPAFSFPTIDSIFRLPVSHPTSLPPLIALGYFNRTAQYTGKNNDALPFTVLSPCYSNDTEPLAISVDDKKKDALKWRNKHRSFLLEVHLQFEYNYSTDQNSYHIFSLISFVKLNHLDHDSYTHQIEAGSQKWQKEFFLHSQPNATTDSDSDLDNDFYRQIRAPGIFTDESFAPCSHSHITFYYLTGSRKPLHNLPQSQDLYDH